MPVRNWRTALRLAPLAVLALTGGRWAAEQSHIPWWVVTLALTGLLAIPASRLALRTTWPALLLAGYLLYPEPDPERAFAVFLATLLVTMINIAPASENVTWPIAVDAALVFASVLALFAITVTKGILPADNGEFQLVAAQAGIAHPPGFPLYTMLASLWVRLPLGGDAALRTNLLSAVVAAGTVAVVFLTIWRLTGRRSASWIGALGLAFAPTFWVQAGVAGIRSTTALFAAMATLGLVGLLMPDRPQGSSLGRPLALFSIAVCFGVTHHPSLAFIALLWAAAVALRLPIWRQTWRTLVIPLVAALLALAPLLYLPWRAASGAWGSTEALQTWPGFLDHVLARGFAGDFFTFTAPVELWQRLRIMGNILQLQFGTWLLALIGLGLAALGRKQRRLALALGLGAVLHIFVTATYRAPQSTEYLMPAYVILAVLLGCGVAWVPGWLPRNWRPVAQALLAGLMLAGIAVTAGKRFPDFAGNFVSTDTADYTQRILAEAPPGALVLANWHWVTPLWYAQKVQELRPDLSVAYVAPAGEPYASTWAEAIRAGLGTGRDVIATWYDVDTYATLPPPEPLGEAFWFRQEPRTTVPASFSPLQHTLGGLRLAGVMFPNGPVPLDETVQVLLAWEPLGDVAGPVGLYVHLVAPDAALVAQSDLTVDPQPEGLTMTRFELAVRPGSAPAPITIYVGVAGSQDGRYRLGEVALGAATTPPVTANPVYREVPSGRPLLRLVGYDWDTSVDGRQRLYLHWQTEAGYQTEVRDGVSPDQPGLPIWKGPWGRWQPMQLDDPDDQQYIPLGQGIVLTNGRLDPAVDVRPGETLIVAPAFTSQRPLLRDMVVSVRLVGFEPDGVHWTWWDLDDWVPALGAIPTLKWTTGAEVRDPHLVKVSVEAYQGQEIGALLRLYDAFTGQPAPVLDSDLAASAIWIPLGNTVLR